METKKSKYDTNPLDPDVERKTEETWGFGGEGAPTQEVGGATQRVGPEPQTVGPDPQAAPRENVYSEAPTRRYDSTQAPKADTGYPSVFIPPTYAPPTQYHPSQVYQPPVAAKPTSRLVAGVNIPEKWAIMLPYAPFYVGLVVSLVELFLVPRKEPQVRFHASQAL